MNKKGNFLKQFFFINEREHKHEVENNGLGNILNQKENFKG